MSAKYLCARVAVLLLAQGFAATLAYAAVSMELAGRSLAGYPFFQYVDAFNSGTAVQIAVDPRMFPSIAGQNVDVYVLENGSPATLGTGVDLQDVRGTPQTVTFGDLAIQANRFELTGSAALAAAPLATESYFGVPYDIVIDMNRNGLLDAEDVIDGAGAAGGFYLVHDFSQTGPRPTAVVNYTVGSVFGVPPGFQTSRLFYPTNIASGERLPLIIFTHGSTQDYRWYDYLGSHMASYGYIVASHQTNAAPGVDAASVTTLGHLDAILAQQGTNPALAPVNGRIDARRIVLMGQGRGAEAVTRAVDRLLDTPPSYSPTGFTADDIVFLLAIAPTDLLGPDGANPRRKSLHMMYGASDGDVSGAPGLDQTNAFNVFERAVGNRSSTYWHAVAHNDFNCCGFSDGTGPGLVGRTAAQPAIRANVTAALQHYVQGRVVAGEYLWRQKEDLKAIGVSSAIVENREYSRAANPNRIVIDDYQSQPSPEISSSGGTVQTNVFNLTEGLLNDADTAFSWSLTTDPMNGMTRARPNDVTRGVVFDTGANIARSMRWNIPEGLRDLRGQKFLSFRACQQTRAPATVASTGDTSWFVFLVRPDGLASLPIRVRAYDGGIEEPYQRAGSGTGTGWQNEFETIRMRLSDFLHNNPNPPDLSNVAAIVMVWGDNTSVVSERIGLDDLEFTPE